MYKLLGIITILTLAIVGCKKHAAIEKSTSSATPIEKLVQRIVPKYKERFLFETNNSQDDFFELESSGRKIIIRGNNYNSIAVGLNYYLKNYCYTYVSWYADDKVELPKELPDIPQKIKKSARVKNRFFLNYCTFGYTMPWWQWHDWERFIDWMALNGINLPLAITGQEAIWYEVWKEYGLSDEQIRTYFTGPAHLPWHRMSNLDKWGGPLPKSWLAHQKELQKKIVQRERELEMKPVLPAFAGHVPKALKKVFPKANINQLSSWGGFEEEYRSFFLDPLDPLFKKIQHKFLKKQTELYGTDHIYGADPFNEVHPPSWEPEYLATVSNTIYHSMKEIDPDAIWLQMSWIFYFGRKHWTNERVKAMIRSVPQNKMMLLDYYCEKQEVWEMTESFFQQPFIWCYLGNFGGNTMLVGNIDEVEKRIENALKNNSNMRGIGSTLEALDVNPLMYNYVFEKVWENKDIDTDKWIQNWADIQYGAKEENSQKVWKLLHRKIYKDPAKLGQATLTNARPALKGNGNWTTDPTINYNNTDLFKVWELLLKNPSNRQSYQYNVVNIGRQVLGNHFKIIRDSFSKNYEDKNLKLLKEDAKNMLELLDDLDRLLATQSSFLLGKWIENAKSFGADEEEQKYYEHNARNIITTWGAAAQSLNDYANRSWAGLTRGFYKKRWELFINDVISSVEDNKKFDEKAFYKKVTQFDWEWTLDNESYLSTPKGSSIIIARELLEKYKNVIEK